MSIKQGRQPESQSFFSWCVVKRFRGGLIGCGCHPKMNVNSRTGKRELKVGRWSVQRNVGRKKLINGSSGVGGQGKSSRAVSGCRRARDRSEDRTLAGVRAGGAPARRRVWKDGLWPLWQVWQGW